MPHDIIKSTKRALISNASIFYDPFTELNVLSLQGSTGFDIVLCDIIWVHQFSKVKFVRKSVNLMISPNPKASSDTFFEWFIVSSKTTKLKVKLWHNNIDHTERFL